MLMTKGRGVSEILDLAETSIFSLAEQHKTTKKILALKQLAL